MQAYKKTKLHYEKAAENRNARLHSKNINTAVVNHRERYKIIRSYLKKIGKTKKGIDIGTGTGVWSEILTDYCERVVGVDFAKQNLKIANENAKKNNLTNQLTYIEGDAESLLDFDINSFDVATHISVLQHLPDQKAALLNVSKILRDGGHLIILVHNSRCIYNRNLKLQNKQNEKIAINNYLSLENLVCLLELAGFQIEEVRMSWIFAFDLLMIGIENSFLKPFGPIRKILILIFGMISIHLGNIRILNPLFREIVIKARKKAN